MICACLGLIIYLVGAFSLLIQAFRESLLWGLFCLFTQIGNFIFAIVFFDKCKRSLGYMVLGVILMILGRATGI